MASELKIKEFLNMALEDIPNRVEIRGKCLSAIQLDVILDKSFFRFADVSLSDVVMVYLDPNWKMAKIIAQDKFIKIVNPKKDVDGVSLILDVKSAGIFPTRPIKIMSEFYALSTAFADDASVENLRKLHPYAVILLIIN